MLNVGIIGCGKIAQVRHLPEYAANPGAHIAALFDLNLKRAQDLAARYGGKAYPSYQALLADPAISGPLADPGQTGAPNLLRYAFGLDRAADPDPAYPTAEILDGDRFFRHRRLLDPDSGVDYVVETASDLLLADWDSADVGTDLIDQGAVPTGDGLTETVEYRLDDDHLPSPRFLRLRVVLTE